MAPALDGPARPAHRRTTLTVRGRCLLAGGAAMTISAIVLDERDLVRIGLFVILLPVLSWVVARQARRSLRVARELTPDRVPVGDAATGWLRIGGGTLLGALRIADVVPDAAGPDPQRPPRFTVHRLGRRGARVGYPLRPTVRGPYRIGPLRGTGTDPLGLAEFTRDLLGPSRLLVLPRVTPLTGRPLVGATAAGRSADGGTRQGAGEPDVLIRPYQHGDEIRRVHWRSTARRDELMVRVDERPDPTGVTVLLDRRDAAHRGHGAGSSLEFAVELAASVCAHLLRRRESVRLLDEDGTVLVEPGTLGTEDDVDRHLDALAELRPSAAAVLATNPSPEGTGTGVLAVLGETTPADVTALTTAFPRGGHAVLLDVSGWSAGTDGPADAAERAATELRRAGWRASVVDAATSVQGAWAAVCGDPSAPPVAGGASGPGRSTPDATGRGRAVRQRATSGARDAGTAGGRR